MAVEAFQEGRWWSCLTLLRIDTSAAKSTSEKRRWCVLHKHFLFYFADKKPNSKPCGVIDLEHMVIHNCSLWLLDCGKERSCVHIPHNDQVHREFFASTSLRLDKMLLTFQRCFVLQLDPESGVSDLEKCLGLYKRHVMYNPVVYSLHAVCQWRQVNELFLWFPTARDTLYGVAICDLVAEHGMPPTKIVDMVKYLLKPECIRSEGLFRISGSASGLSNLRSRQYISDRQHQKKDGQGRRRQL